MAKVIEFYKREDWKAERESIPEGQLAKVIMFPNTTSSISRMAGVVPLERMT